MPAIDALYNWLARDVTPAANQIFAAALPSAEEPWVGRIGRILVERRHESAWCALAANYLRFESSLQEKIRQTPAQDLVRRGLALALGLTDSHARRNALGLLCDMPSGEMAPSAAACLNDGAPATRAMASAALQLLAERALTETPQDLPAIVAALHEALRTYDRHREVGVLRLALWFPCELGEPLWASLGSGPGRCGAIVEQKLDEWNEPRLAAFLVLGLARPAWRKPAEAALLRWNTHEHLLALLDQAGLLTDPAVRRALPRLNRPRFFVEGLSRLAELTPAQRASVPHWLCVLGFSEQERLRCLELCATSQWAELQRSAAHALPNLSDAVAVRALAEVASREGAGRLFARWYVTGRRALPPSAGPRGTASIGAAATEPEGEAS